MIAKSLTLTGMICLVGMGFMSAPACADDAARTAVQGSILAIQSVHTYRITTVTHRPGFGKTDLTTVTELTETPRRTHSFVTVGSEMVEQVIDGTTLYIRLGRSPWKKTAMPGTFQPSWGSNWRKRFDPAASYQFVRNDVLHSVPVKVYSASRIERFRREDTQIWIGATDHLPHRIVRDLKDGKNFESVTTETLGGFNTPINIAVPNGG